MAQSSSIPLRLTAAALLLNISIPTIHAATTTPWGYQTGILPYAKPSSNGQPPPEADNDDTYAGDIYYNPDTHVMYLTGGTYSGSNFDAATAGSTSEFHLPASDCFVAAIAPPDAENVSDAPKNIGGEEGQLLFTARYGTRTVADVCSALVPVNVNVKPMAAGADPRAASSEHLVAIGHSEEGGVMTDLRTRGSDKATVYGYAMDLEVIPYTQNGNPATASPRGVQHLGGRLFHEETVQYPVAIATPPPAAQVGDGYGDKAAVYVVMMTTDNDSTTKRWDANAVHPDITAGGGGGVQKYGGGAFSIVVKKLGWRAEYGPKEDASPEDFDDSVTGEDIYENLVTVYTQEYATNDDKTARVSSLLYVPHQDSNRERKDFLLMAGQTKGFGLAFGQDHETDTSGGEDADGFVTKLDPRTGKELFEPTADTANTDLFTNTQSLRIGTQPGENEHIHGICVNRNSDDVRDVYVVGSTTGKIDPDAPDFGGGNSNGDQVTAFVAKLDLNSMNLEWKKQWGTTDGTDAYATGCAVTDNGTVYVGGNTGGQLTGNGINVARAHGKDDIFVVRIYEVSGEVVWAKQIGTDMNDRLATNGGVAVDKDDSVVIFGTTHGAMMRERADDGPRTSPKGKNPADVFVMSISHDGQHRLPIEQITGHSPEAGQDVSNTVTVGGGDSGGRDPNFPDQPTGNVPVSSSGSQASSNGLTGANKFLIAIISLSGACVLILFAYKVGHRKGGNGGGYNKSYDNSHITQYLKDFDDMEVAIRPSATGGWHGMYDTGDKGGADLGSNVPEEVSFGLGGGSADKHGDTASLSKESVSSGSLGSVRDDIVKEALFFDEDEEPSKKQSEGLFQIDDDDDGNEQEGGEKKWGAGYAGLVESYNESWKERSPMGMGGFGNEGLPADSSPRIGGNKAYKDKPTNKDKPTEAEIV